MTAKNSPVVIFASNRPKYFKECFEAVKRELNTRKLIIVLDKPLKDAGFYEHAHLKIIGDLPCEKIIRNTHFGLGNNLIDAKKYIFINKFCHFCHFIEDDYIVSPGGLNFTENIMDWCTSNYDNVGLVTPWNDPAVQCYTGDDANNSRKCAWPDNRLTKPEGLEFTLESSWNHSYHILQSKASWDASKYMILWYQQQFLKGKLYNQRNHKNIQNWRLSQIHFSKIPQKGPKILDVNSDRCQNQLTSYSTTQDCTTHSALFCAGYTRVAPVLSRGAYIGKSGENFTQQIWDMYEFDKQKSWHTQQDSTNKEFNVME